MSTGSKKIIFFWRVELTTLPSSVRSATWIIHQQLWGYKVEDKFHLGGTRTKEVEYCWSTSIWNHRRANYARFPDVFSSNVGREGFHGFPQSPLTAPRHCVLRRRTATRRTVRPSVTRPSAAVRPHWLQGQPLRDFARNQTSDCSTALCRGQQEPLTLRVRVRGKAIPVIGRGGL
jgi:hypothetical protein